jgi:hypothetical protein
VEARARHRQQEDASKKDEVVAAKGQRHNHRVAAKASDHKHKISAPTTKGIATWHCWRRHTADTTKKQDTTPTLGITGTRYQKISAPTTKGTATKAWDKARGSAEGSSKKDSAETKGSSITTWAKNATTKCGSTTTSS